ncbi:hypothetical protein [Streptomyces sp. NPDC001594]|uniref:hypothetical protein n=1 Tax=Streptomyces sp. NPDC001594 TaxID=3364590 RepID=UPI0036B8725E
MAFGRNTATAEPFEPVPWEGITRFTVGRVLRDAVRASRRGTGAHAVRVPRLRGGEELMVPALYIAPAGPDGVPLRQGGFRLYEDEGRTRLLCSVLPEGPGGEHHRVTDAAGRQAGTVHRTPAAQRLVRHGWWLEQPGHPEVTAPRPWAEGGPGRIVGRGVGKVLGSVADSILSLGAEGDGGGPPQPVLWRSGEETVLSFQPSQGPRWYAVEREGWLDKRLAFALVVLRESEVWGADRR